MTKYTLKKFNENGEKKFEDFFDRKLKNKKIPVPFKYLNDDNLTQELDIKIEIDNKVESLNISNSAAIVFHHLSYLKKRVD